jgi:hypothetical protein
MEFDDQQRGLVPAAGIERGGELRVVVSASALDLGKALNNEFPVPVEEDNSCKGCMVEGFSRLGGRGGRDGAG